MRTRSFLLLPFLALALTAQTPKNVIFFLGDGMGPVTVTASRIYQVGEGGSLAMDRLPHTARIRTHSENGQTTDSAPSMSAYMTGLKINNAVISMSPDTKAVKPKPDGTTNWVPGNGYPVTTLLELAKARGMGTGVVTTTTITHATPAATYAHVPHRDAEVDIAAQAVPSGEGYNVALRDGIDVLLGGGLKFFKPKSAGGVRPDGRDLVAELQADNYTFVGTGSALAATTATRLVGLFAPSHMDYDLDRVKNKLDQPSLAQMTAKALDILSKNSNGYFLMVEGGKIDHALHGTNAKRALTETVAFDQAIQAALAKVDLSNTLIVVTADHDHTMVFNGYPKLGNPILDIVRDYRTGEPALDADGNTYTTLTFGTGPNRPDIRKSLVSGDADKTQVLHDDYQQETAIRMGGDGHAGGDVKLFAAGAGSGAFKGTMENNKVFTLIKAALGL